MQPNPDLLDELYHKQRKNFPDELQFPERFNLKLTENAFNKGIIRVKKRDIQKFVDWQGNPIREEPIIVIEYEQSSRLDKAFEDSFPKSFCPPNFVFSELYDNIQLGAKNDELDMEYNFFFNPVDANVTAILQKYDTAKKWENAFSPLYKGNDPTLRVRIQYADRIVNSAGPRWDCYGYIYIPQRKTQCI